MARPDIIQAEVVGSLTLVELSRAGNVPADWIADLVDQGLLVPRGGSRTEWEFEGHCLSMVTRAHRLQRDLGLNVEGVALALSLLEEAERLRRRIDHLEAALAARD